MPVKSFLDKGVVLGFCFPVDLHHRNCKEYLLNENTEFYLTEEIESIYEAKRQQMVEEHREAIFDHARYVRKNFDSEMGPMELNNLRGRLSRRSNEASEYLMDYYNGKQFAYPRNVASDLRDFARGMESHVSERKEEFDELVEIWEREDEYPELENCLGDIRLDKEEDYWVCVDAHDLGVKTSGETELATVDVDDLASEEREELITRETSIDAVRSLAVTSG